MQVKINTILIHFLSEEKNFIKLEILRLLFESQDASVITSILGSDCVFFFHNDSDSVLHPFWGIALQIFSCEWKLDLHRNQLNYF